MLVSPGGEKFKPVIFSVKGMGFSGTKRTEMNYISSPFIFVKLP